MIIIILHVIIVLIVLILILIVILLRDGMSKVGMIGKGFSHYYYYFQD